jgi:hypothetical protein
MVKRTVTLRFEDGLLAEIIGQQSPFAASSGQTSSAPGAVASFVKKQPAADPQDASIEEAQEEVLGADPDIDTVRERDAAERDYERERDVLDQTPDDGPMGPDIDG